MKNISDFKWFICNFFDLHKFEEFDCKDGHKIYTCIKCNYVKYI